MSTKSYKVVNRKLCNYFKYLYAFIAFRLLAAPVIIEGHEKKSSSGSFLEMSATAAKLILHELRPMQKNTETVIPLLEFIQMNKAAHMALLTKPQLKIKIKVLQKSNSSSASARSRHKPPRSELRSLTSYYSIIFLFLNIFV